jgi:integrase
VGARPKAETITCGEWAGRWLEGREREGGKLSSIGTARQALGSFRERFGERPIGSIDDVEAEDWALAQRAYCLPPVVSLMNYAVRKRVIDHNPFAGIVRRGRGRRDQNPPTEEQFDALLLACSALGDYAEQMRALLLVGAYTGMRQGELYELRWEDIDLGRNRVTVSRRVYRGVVDTPKSGKAKVIALPPPAKDALMGLPSYRTGGLVFRSMEGHRLSPPIVCDYWRRVREEAASGYDRPIYHATKHYGVNLLWKLGVPEHVIAVQMGWSSRDVSRLLDVYAHRDVAALEAIDALYATEAFADRMHEIRNPAP